MSPSASAVAERFRRRADAFEALIVGTAPERWTGPSPCEGWVARDIVAHIVGFPSWRMPSAVVACLRDVGLVPDRAPVALERPEAAFRRVREALQRLFDDPTTPGDVVAHLDAAVSFDLAQHWWDLAKATGQDATMDPEEVELLWTTLSPMPPSWWRWQVDHGYYAASVPVPEAAPLQDRVLGLIGRDPRWTPTS